MKLWITETEKVKRQAEEEAVSHLTALETESKKTSPLPGLPLCCAHFGLSGTHGLQLLSGGQQYPFCDPCTCGIGGVIGTGVFLPKGEIVNVSRQGNSNIPDGAVTIDLSRPLTLKTGMRTICRCR